jgi:hypothetical protein
MLDNISALKELSRLQSFVRDLIDLADWPEGGDIDGFEFQDLAVKHGLLLPETRYKPCSEEHCSCASYYADDEWEDGITCYRLDPSLLPPNNGLQADGAKAPQNLEGLTVEIVPDDGAGNPTPRS